MKTTLRERVAGMVVFLLLNQVSMMAEEGAVKKYSTSVKGKTYCYEIKELSYCTILKQITDPTSKDSVIIPSMGNQKALNAAINTLTAIDVIKGEKVTKEEQVGEITSQLMTQYLKDKQAEVLVAKAAATAEPHGSNVGTISLKKNKVGAHLLVRKSFNPEKRVNVEVKSADIAFEKGIIKDLLVRANIPGKDTVAYFSNLKYIPVRNAQDIDNLMGKDRNYLRYSCGADSILAIDLADVIDYNRRIPFASGTYIPGDTIISLDRNANKTFALNKPSLAESFDVRLYTDVLGYNNNSTNGIVQVEAQLNVLLNQGSCTTSLIDIWQGVGFNKYRHQWIWLNRISPYIKLNKIEKAQDILGIDVQTKKGDLLDLFKYSYFNVGTELNVLTYRSDSKLFTFNTALGVLRTKIGNDSIEKNNIYVSTAYVNPNIDLQFFESDRVDFNLKVGMYGAWTVSDIKATTLSEAKVNIQSYVFDINNYWAQLQQSINLHPGGNKANSIFLRAAQYIGAKNNYFSFQIGYATSLSSLLKF